MAVENAPTRGPAPEPTRGQDRRFYSRTSAFGRFGIRIFTPALMGTPHWHGHVELNYMTAGTMAYLFDGEPLTVDSDRLVVFWAGIPHQLVGVDATADARPELANIYLPLDSFLFMGRIAPLQIALLAGAMVTIPRALCGRAQIDRWYADYRSNDYDRQELVKAELNVLFRRTSLAPFDFVRAPLSEGPKARAMSPTNIGQVVRMVRYALENLDRPLRSAEVTAVTGLNVNYALGLFSRTMHLSLKQFIIRMRLVRARGLLLESDMPIASVALDCGFTSLSQFYRHFQSGYGTSPNVMRKSYPGQPHR